MFKKIICGHFLKHVPEDYRKKLVVEVTETSSGRITLELANTTDAMLKNYFEQFELDKTLATQRIGGIKWLFAANKFKVGTDVDSHSTLMKNLESEVVGSLMVAVAEDESRQPPAPQIKTKYSADGNGSFFKKVLEALHKSNTDQDLDSEIKWYIKYRLEVGQSEPIQRSSFLSKPSVEAQLPFKSPETITSSSTALDSNIDINSFPTLNPKNQNQSDQIHHIQTHNTMFKDALNPGTVTEISSSIDSSSSSTTTTTSTGPPVSSTTTTVTTVTDADAVTSSTSLTLAQGALAGGIGLSVAACGYGAYWMWKGRFQSQKKDANGGNSSDGNVNNRVRDQRVPKQQYDDDRYMLKEIVIEREHRVNENQGDDDDNDSEMVSGSKSGLFSESEPFKASEKNQICTEKNQIQDKIRSVNDKKSKERKEKSEKSSKTSKDRKSGRKKKRDKRDGHSIRKLLPESQMEISKESENLPMSRYQVFTAKALAGTGRQVSGHCQEVMIQMPEGRSSL